MEETITNLIGNYAFPIVMCLVMFYQMNRNEERHKQEVDKLSEVVENNNKLLERVVGKIEGE